MKKNRLNGFYQKLIVLLAIFTISVSAAFAQKTITGVVKDDSGEPLPGVNVIIKGTTTGTITDFDGNYSIEVQSDEDILMFSMVGMATEEVAAGSITGEPMMLLPDLVGLDEVVVVGYGTLKKKDITGSVASIGSDDILTSPITSLDAGLQGKMPGVTLQQTTGAPGGSMKVRIRGSSSINYGNQPLYVIDGFVGGDMNSVNPGDIERIDILKDASATAIYGARGSNGVVLITTKTAKAGDFRISLDGTWGFSNQIKDIEVLDRHSTAVLYNESRSRAGLPDYFNQTVLDSFAQYGTQYPLDYITRKAVTQNYNLSMSGGNDKVTYLFSTGYINEEGVIEESFREKYSIRSNVKADIKPWLDIKFNTYATHDRSMHTGANTNGVHRAIYDSYYHKTIWDIYLPDGSYARPENWLGFGDIVPDRPNPIEYNKILANGENLNEGVTSNIDFNFKITDDITFTTTASGRYALTYNGNIATPDGKFIVTEKDMTARNRYQRNRQLMTTNILTYKKTFGLHDITATAVYEYSNDNNRWTEARVSSLATAKNKWYQLSNGSPSYANSAIFKREIQSYMFRAIYGFADRYTVTGSVRRDETSVFRPGHEADEFIAAAAAWTISEENFMSTIEWISNLKLRVGWGQTGNMALGPNEASGGLQTPYGYGYAGYYTFDGTEDGIVGGPTPRTNFVDPGIQWETQVQTNFGLDLTILEGKFNFTADYYLKQSKELILRQLLPESSGIATYTGNFGQINNSGFEFMVDWAAVEYSDLKVNVGANISVNRNKVVDLGDDENGNEVTEVEVDETNLGNTLFMWSYADERMFTVQKGQPLGQIRGLQSLGLVQESDVDPATGKNIYQNYAGEHKYLDKADENGDVDGIIDGDDRVVIGNSQADFTYGINLNVTYKMFNLAVGGVGSYGNDLYNYNRHYMDMNMMNPAYKARWTPTNTGAEQQAAQAGPSGLDKYLSSQYVEDGSYFKIKNVTLSCNIPDQWLEYVKINSFSVFASANNLLTITKYTGMDPEGSSTGNNSEAMSGLDAWSYPLARTFTFGFKTNF